MPQALGLNGIQVEPLGLQLGLLFGPDSVALSGQNVMDCVVKLCESELVKRA